MTEKGITVKICPKCSNSFNCCGESDCWCENVKIPTANSNFILLNYQGCLCPACLNSESKRDLKNKISEN